MVFLVSFSVYHKVSTSTKDRHTFRFLKPNVSKVRPRNEEHRASSAFEVNRSPLLGTGAVGFFLA